MRLVSFDTETHLIQPGLAAPPLVCGSFAWETSQPGENDAVIHDKEGTLALFRSLIIDPDVHITGANTAYDMAVVCAEDPTLIPLVFAAYKAGRVHDILIRQALDAIACGCLFLDPRKPLTFEDEDGNLLHTFKGICDPGTGKASNRYSLAIVVALLFGRKDAKENDFWRKRYAMLEGKPLEEWPELARQYPIDDAGNTLECHLEQDRQKFMNLSAGPEQAYAAFCLHLACVWGMRTDADTVARITERVEAQYAKDLKRFQEVGIYRANETMDTKRLQALVSDAYEGEPPRTATGVSRSRDTLIESGDETLIALGLAGVNTKTHTQYLDILKSGIDVPINPSANVLVKTTRTSYSRPNLQNIPRAGIREAFVARPGYVLCSVDYGSLELCTLAQTCLRLFGFSDLAIAINRGDDLHVRLGAMATNLDYAVLLLKVTSENSWAKNIRQGSKAGNYGFGGGMGAPKFVLTQRKDITVETLGPDGRKYYGTRFCILFDADTVCGREKIRKWAGRGIPPTCKACVDTVIPLKAAWLKTWSETPLYFDYIARETDIEGGGFLEIPGTGLYKGRCGYTDGANLGFQGPAAIGAKRALTRASYECYADKSSPLYGSRPIVFVHDEIIAEVPEDRFGPAGDRLAFLMREAMQEITPDVTISAEPAFCRQWLKGMKTIRDAAGNHQIWAPPAR